MKFSLRQKIVILLILSAIVLSSTCIGASWFSFKKIMDNEYMITSDSMAATIARSVDGDKMQEITEKVVEIYNKSDNKIDNTRWEEPEFEEYAEQFYHLMDDPVYIEMRDRLRELQDVSEIDCAYTLYVDPVLKNAIYIVDAAYDEDEIVTPGCFDIVEPSCEQYLDTPEVGFPAFISKTSEYGWMVTSCVPIYNSNGDIVCYSTVDINMNDVLSSEYRFIFLLAIVLLILTSLICILSILYVNRKIVNPINQLSEAAEKYGKNQDIAEHKEFSSIDINTGDELEILLDSMKKMETDIENYINNLTHTKNELNSARIQADSMQKLAVKDSLTGIRNRLAYDNEIKLLEEEHRNGLDKFGIAVIDLNFLKVINDTYGHERGNLAIVLLSKLICKVFQHSPVFRIGGDEFAVILKDSDYENIEGLKSEFVGYLTEMTNDKALEPWEKVSAAIGYALFEPQTDTSVDDVFKRADAKMYECKKAMKAMRK